MLKKLLRLSLLTFLFSPLLASEDIESFLDSLDFSAASSPEGIYRSISTNEGCLTRTLDNGQQIKLYFNIQGEGKETLLFVHGFPFSSNEWACQVKEFRKKYRVLTIDLRGMGRSSKVPVQSCQDFIDDIHFVVSELGIKKYVYIGHSFGGAPLGVLYALQFPQEVCKLVIAEGSPQLLSTDTAQFGLPGSIVGQFIALLTSKCQDQFVEFANIWNGLAFNQPCDVTHIIEVFNQIILNNDPCVLGTIFENICATSIADVLPQVSVPTLIIAGGLDRSLPPGASFFMRTQIPHSKLFVFSCAAHMSFVTQPDVFNDVLKKFLKGKFKDDCFFGCNCNICPCINANLNGACVPPSSCVQCPTCPCP